MKIIIAAALFLSILATGAVNAQSLNDMVSSSQLASFCADRDVGETSKAALALPDGAIVKGEIACSASAVAEGRALAGLPSELPLQANDRARAAIASAAERGRPDDAGRPMDAGRPDDAGRPADAGRPDGAGQSADSGRPASAGGSADAGSSGNSGRPEGAGRP